MAPNSARPYFRSSSEQLVEAFASSRDDIAALQVLRVELQYRNTPAAVRLRQQVEARLGELQTQATYTPRKPPVADLTPNPPVQGDLWPRNAGSANPAPGPNSQTNDHLRRPGRTKLIEPLGVRGRPPKYVRPPKTSVTLYFPSGASRAARYAIALGALIADMRDQKQATRQIVLEDGERVPLDPGHIGYSFGFQEDTALFEEARIEVRLGGRAVDGQVVSLSGGYIIIAVEEDLGPAVSRCVLIIDNTALIEALKERLEKIGSHGRAINTELADDVVSNNGEASPLAAAPSSEAFWKLVPDQKNAVRLALSNKVTYVWGPPGTGKTRTLSVLAQELFDAGKRSLICSNTNRAVDQVLLNLCQTLGTAHPAMERGQILRLGRITHDQLRQDYSEYVSLDGTVERRARDVRERKLALEDELAAIARRSEKVETLREYFSEFDRAREAHTQQEAETTRLAKEGKAAVQKRDAAEGRLGELSRELETASNAGAVRRIFLRSEAAISKDISETKTVVGDADADAVRLVHLYQEAKEKRDALAARRDALSQALASVDRPALTKQMEGFDAQRQPLLNELATVNKALADIRASVMRDAAVIGATVTKAYLSAKDLPDFDVVIVDEASMVLLPALYYAVGLAKNKAVISGDFRQLPPIILTEEKAILDEIGHDVFHSAGIVAPAESGQGHPRLVMLE